MGILEDFESRKWIFSIATALFGLNTDLTNSMLNNALSILISST